jgi:hypothetical protein
VCICQIVFWQLEDDCNENEKFSYDLLPDITVEACNLCIIFLDDLMFGFFGVSEYSFWDIELEELSAYMQKINILHSYHLDILLYSSITNPPGILSITKILSFGKVTGSSAFLL